MLARASRPSRGGGRTCHSSTRQNRKKQDDQVPVRRGATTHHDCRNARMIVVLGNGQFHFMIVQKDNDGYSTLRAQRALAVYLYGPYPKKLSRYTSTKAGTGGAGRCGLTPCHHTEGLEAGNKKVREKNNTDKHTLI